jgi:hypothetical protein
MPRFALGSHGEGRLTIRAARFVCEADFPRGAVGEQTNAKGIWQNREKRGGFEGAIRISLRAPSFLFNSLAFLRIPLESLYRVFREISCPSV